jgi:hypothetical protein
VLEEGQSTESTEFNGDHSWAQFGMRHTHVW